MKEVYLLRHAEKDTDGLLTESGKTNAQELRNLLPPFAAVYASPSDRARLTAELIAGKKPKVDDRANFYMAVKDKSDVINNLAASKGISFLDAVQEYGDHEVINGVDSKARELNGLVNELIMRLSDDEKALIVSHDLSISPAIAQRGIKKSSIDYLSGYVINEDGDVSAFNANSSS